MVTTQWVEMISKGAALFLCDCNFTKCFWNIHTPKGKYSGQKYFSFFFFIENYVENSADLDWIIENIRPLNQLLKLKIRKFCLLTVTNCKFWQLSYSVLRFVYVVKYEKKFIWICVRNRFILLTKEVLTSQVKSSQDLLALTDWKEKEKENV